MSVTTTIHCDKCGCVVADQRTALTVECGPLRAHRAGIDLCVDCAHQLVGFLRNPDDAAALALDLERGPRPSRLTTTTAWAGALANR